MKRIKNCWRNGTGYHLALRAFGPVITMEYNDTQKTIICRSSNVSFHFLNQNFLFFLLSPRVWLARRRLVVQTWISNDRPYNLTLPHSFLFKKSVASRIGCWWLPAYCCTSCFKPKGGWRQFVHPSGTSGISPPQEDYNSFRVLCLVFRVLPSVDCSSIDHARFYYNGSVGYGSLRHRSAEVFQAT